MAHLTADRLAGHVLGTDDPLTAAEENHLATCAECRKELTELSRIADLSGQPEHVDPQLVPMDAMWQSVQSQLHDQTVSSATTTVQAERPPSPPIAARPDRTRKRRSLLLAAAAAILGLIIGAGMLAEEFLIVARGMDWLEVQLWKVVHWVAQWWKHAPRLERYATLLVMACALGATAYGMYEFLVA